jgi:integrase
MKRNAELPPRVYEKGRWFYLVTADGKKRVWTKLTRVRDGMASLYTKLADIAARDIAPDRMPAVVAEWQREVMAAHTKKTQADDKFRCKAISNAFAEFRASQVKPPDVAEFLKQFKAMPRTFNAYRAAVREMMRFAEEKGYRDAGTNPVDSLRTMQVKARTRYITDSELRRIKVAAMYGLDGLRTRSGATICALVDLAYLTGQRISDLLALEWKKDPRRPDTSYIDVDGINFAPGKIEASTGQRVLIEWTPRLREVVERLKAMKRRNIRTVICTQEGQPYTYWGASTAWRRAVARSGVLNAHFHDLRAKALTDKEQREGMPAARRMGAHSTETQTADYVRHKTAQKTAATR